MSGHDEWAAARDVAAADALMVERHGELAWRLDEACSFLERAEASAAAEPDAHCGIVVVDATIEPLRHAIAAALAATRAAVELHAGRQAARARAEVGP